MAAGNRTWQGNGTASDSVSVSVSGQQDGHDYDAVGALEFIVVTLGVYSLLGVLSLLLVRIIRRAKLRWDGQADRQADRQTGRQIGRQADRQTGRQT